MNYRLQLSKEGEERELEKKILIEESELEKKS